MRLIIGLLLLLCVTKIKAQFLMDNTNEVVTCPSSDVFYDSGGNGGQYANSENFTKTFTSNDGSCLQFAFTTFTTESCCDRLRIYDGPSGASPLIGTYAGGSSPGTIISSGSSLTFSWTSDGSVVRDGWEADISCVAPCSGAPAAGTTNAAPSSGSVCTAYNTTITVSGSSSGCGISYQWQSAPASAGPYANISGAVSATYTQNISTTTFFRRITTCGASSATSTPASATFSCNGYVHGSGTQTLNCPPTFSLYYDSGGPGGQYANSQNLTKTFTSNNGNCLQFAFTTFTTESCCDRLRIFDGPSGASPLIGTYAGGSSPGTIISSGSSLTFSFTSDGSVTRDGWEANISCIAPCTGTPNSGTAFATPSSSCATFATTVDVTGSAPGCGMTYQWQSASAVGGPYTNIAGATRPTYTQNISATTFFQRITTCGAASATSAVGTASISNPTISCDLNTYTASTTTYNFENFTGTSLPTTDDVLFSAVTQFGFNFCFGGQQFSGGYVASNSAFVFDAFPCNPNILTNTYAAPGIGTGYSITQAAPNPTTSIPRNAILAPWHDIHPNNTATLSSSKIQYITLGTAPNRRTLISWEDIPYFSCGGTLTPFFSGQIKLFETSNIIEIHIKDKEVCSTFNGGYAVMGLHNYNGTIYVPPVNATAHNRPTQWTMSNSAYKFQTNCSAVCSVPLSIEFKNFYGQQIDEINKLWWETADEKDVKEFIVERSTDAQNFSPVYNIAAQGKPSAYTYNDNAYTKGYINYYRITAVEFDGKRTSTHPIPLFNTNDKALIKSVYPNPAHEKLLVEIHGRGAYTECAFTIYDQFGKTVLQQNKPIKFGDNTIDVNIGTIEQGIYILEIKSPDNQLINRQKFTKL